MSFKESSKILARFSLWPVLAEALLDLVPDDEVFEATVFVPFEFGFFI